MLNAISSCNQKQAHAVQCLQIHVGNVTCYKWHNNTNTDNTGQRH